MINEKAVSLPWRTWDHYSKSLAQWMEIKWPNRAKHWEWQSHSTNKIFNPEFSIQSNYQSGAWAWNKAISSVSPVHLIKKLIYLLTRSKLLEDMLWQDQEANEEKQDLGPRDKNVHWMKTRKGNLRMLSISLKSNRS